MIDVRPDRSACADKAKLVTFAFTSIGSPSSMKVDVLFICQLQQVVPGGLLVLVAGDQQRRLRVRQQPAGPSDRWAAGEHAGSGDDHPAAHRHVLQDSCRGRFLYVVAENLQRIVAVQAVCCS